MSASAQYPVGTAPTLLASAPASGVVGPTGWMYLVNGSGGTIYLGAAGVTSTNGAPVAASTSFTGYLFPGDVVYAVTASGTSTVSVLQTGV
jgi:hypothetical protein